MQRTTNYEIFKKQTTNRPIRKENVDKILSSITNKNMLHLRPIIVNKDMEVIDGQHRLEAAKKLNLDLYYVVHEESDDYDMILLNNNQKRWTLYDYLNYYCEKGHPEYLSFKEFLSSTTWIDITSCLTIIGKNNGLEWRKFKEGKLEFKKSYEVNATKVMFIEEIIKVIKNTLVTRNKKPFSGTRFIAALGFLCSQDEFDMDLFCKKLQGRLDCLHACATTEGYLQMLKGIYNYRNQNPIA